MLSRTLDGKTSLKINFIYWWESMRPYVAAHQQLEPQRTLQIFNYGVYWKNKLIAAQKILLSSARNTKGNFPLLYKRKYFASRDSMA